MDSFMNDKYYYLLFMDNAIGGGGSGGVRNAFKVYACFVPDFKTKNNINYVTLINNNNNNKYIRIYSYIHEEIESNNNNNYSEREIKAYNIYKIKTNNKHLFSFFN
ncbi:hypothetical protein BCR36DRAFT_368555 [Piromyces finnis]|uniref:Uncharacterized protein n=1 Tax=Piromyces finnis TaxID=1754191 RepID=A0A1Y1VF26_9FUNG|nr:hypothetical protein BCR36DRAFT_368555 [Piromyces finnis]|eukprot:ORX54170.1 hypothetical protein BCR36DRAFT_368555 [Piromyces finnis]